MRALGNKSAHPAGLIGVFFVCTLLCAAFASALGFRVNVTVASLVPAVTVLLLSRPLRNAAWSGLAGSDWALAVFVLSAAAAMAMSLPNVGALPLDYMLHAAALLLLCPLAYVLGRVLAANATPRGLENLFRLALILTICFVALTFALPDLVSTEESVRGSYYQYSGDCLAVTALIHLLMRQKSSPRWMLLLVLPVLVLIGSRASVASYGIALLFSQMLPFVAVLAVAAVGVWLLLEDTILSLVPELFDATRVVTTLLGAAIEGREDASLLERQQFQAMAFESIKNHPLFGHFGYDYYVNGFVGGFSHSALDLWAQYGLMTFLAFIVMLVLTPILGLIRVHTRRGWSRTPASTWALFVFLLLEFTFFRHPESVVLFFGAGALVGLSRRAAAPVMQPSSRWRRRV